MIQGGWIKIHRKMVGWEWYSNPTTFCVWMHLLIEANHEPTKWHGLTIDAGQLVTTVKQLTKSTGLSVQQVRTALSNIQSTNEITIKATNKFSIITICKYVQYQMRKTQEQQTKQQTSEQTNNKPYNIYKEDKKKRIFIKPSLQEVIDYCFERHNTIDAEQFIAYYESCNWMRGKTKIVDWKAAVRTWERNNKHYRNGTDNRRGTEVPAEPNYAKSF